MSAREVTFTTDDGLRLVGEERGSPAAPLALLLHGGGQTRHAWARNTARLEGEGYCVVSYDSRGHGESDWSPEGDYTLSTYGRDLLAVLRALDRPAALVGASLGGTTSLLAASERPGQIRSLILVDIVPGFVGKGVQRIRAFMTANPDGFDNLDEAAAAVAAYYPHRTKGNPAGLMRNLREGLDGRLRWHWDPRVIGEAPTPATSEMLAGKLASLPENLPLLLIAGALSDIVDAKAIESFRTLARHAEVVSVARAGHMVAGDRNDAFGAAISTFLRQSNPALS